MSEASETINAINRLRASKMGHPNPVRMEPEAENAHFLSAYEAGCVEGRTWALESASYTDLEALGELHAAAFATSATAHSARSKHTLNRLTAKHVRKDTPEGFLEGFAAGASRVWDELKDKI